MTSILEYLHTTYGIDGFADQKLWIDNFSLSLPWEGRQSLLSEAEKLFTTRFSARNTRDRNIHAIGVVGGHSGIGKSRALVELIDPIKSWHGLTWTIPVVISYNDGNPPSVDRNMAPAQALALRILYFALVAGRTDTTSIGVLRVTFERFVTSMPTHLREQLTPQSAIEVLAILAERKFGSTEGMVYLAVDEVNYLLDADYEGETQKRAFLKGTMVALGEILLSGAVFVFGVVAGTTVMPLDMIFAESSHPTVKLPIGLLSYPQCESLLDKLAVHEPDIWRNWKTCRVFKTLVADFAAIPRKLETLLRCVREAVTVDSTGEMSIHDLDFKDIYAQLQFSTGSMASLMPYASTLIAVVMLSTPVEREAFVLEGDTNSWTYGALEETGNIVLATTELGATIVQLPYSTIRKLVATLTGTDPLTVALRRAFNLTDNASDGFSWQSFEELHANVEAIREMLLARRLGEETTMSLNEFYCTSSPVSSAVDDTLEFELRTHCHVNAVTSRFPAQQSEVDLCDHVSFFGSDSSGSLLDAATTMIKNVPGALFDTFTVRKVLGGDRLLVCGHQKFYQATEVTKEMVRDEAAKVALGLPETANHVLVMVATRMATYGDGDRVPDRCVLLTGAALERFYGPVFSGRVILTLSGTQVDINTATNLELRTVPGVGETLAKRIINVRKNAPIASWSDALDRVYRLPSASERHWKL